MSIDSGLDIIGEEVCWPDGFSCVSWTLLVRHFGCNFLVDKAPQRGKVSSLRGNVCVVIHVCPPAVFRPVTNQLNGCLLNVKGSQNSYYVLDFSWEHPLEMFLNRIYWSITSDDGNLAWTDFLGNFMNNINCMSDSCWSCNWFWY